MKKRFVTLVLFLIVCVNQFYSQTPSTTLAFEERVFDFGEILEKTGKASHTFIFKNTSHAPIAITKIVSGCGCIEHEYSSKPVNPGEKGKITVTYNPAYRPGFFSKEIVVTGNDNNLTRIWVKGSVIPDTHPVEEDYPYNFGSGLHLSLKVLAFGRITEGKSKEIELRYANDTDRPMILNFITDDKNISFANPGELSPKERGKLTVGYTVKENRQGEIHSNIYLIVNGKKLSQPLQVKVTK